MIEFLMCSSPLNKRKPDEAYTSEYEAALKFTKVHLFDIYNLDSVKLPPVDNQVELIYHGWMMPPAHYNKLYDACMAKGYRLINSPEQYIGCHHFNGWYPVVKDLTANSKIIPRASVREMMDEVISFMQETNSAVIIKDFVKSLKHLWHEACFIPHDASPLDVAKVISKFVSIKESDNDFQGDLVVRQFVQLQKVGNHSKSNMPLTQEFRSFVFRGEIIFLSKYWDEGNYSNEVPPQNLLDEVARRIYNQIGSNLFTIDVAKLESGDWTVIEVGDGQVSALPDQEDRERFFSALTG